MFKSSIKHVAIAIFAASSFLASANAAYFAATVDLEN
jgi:hypothetical protein